MKKLILMLLLSRICFGAEPIKEKESIEDKGDERWSASFSSQFPLWIGVQSEVLIFDRWAFHLGYGIMPQLYSSAIGGLAAKIGNKDVYEPLLESVFDSTKTIVFGGAYRPQGQVGWYTGLRFYVHQSEGKVGVSDVLQAATGRTYPALIAALVAQGKSQVVNTEMNLLFTEVHFGHSWLVKQNFGIEAGFGLTKVISAGVKLNTEASSFDASDSGNATLRQAENEIEAILRKYGILPVFTVAIKYWF